MKYLPRFFSASLLVLSMNLEASVTTEEEKTAPSSSLSGTTQNPKRLKLSSDRFAPVQSDSDTEEVGEESTPLQTTSSAYWRRDQEEIQREKSKSPGFPLQMRTGRYVTEEEMERKEALRLQKMMMQPLRNELEQKVFERRQRMIKAFESSTPEEMLPFLPDPRIAAVLSPLAIREVYLNKDDTPVQRMKKCIYLGVYIRNLEEVSVNPTLLKELSSICFLDAVKAGLHAEPFIPSYGKTDYYLSLGQISFWAYLNLKNNPELLTQAENFVSKAKLGLDTMLDFPSDALKEIEEETLVALIEEKEKEREENRKKIQSLLIHIHLTKALNKLLPSRTL